MCSCNKYTVLFILYLDYGIELCVSVLRLQNIMARLTNTTIHMLNREWCFLFFILFKFLTGFPSVSLRSL